MPTFDEKNISGTYMATPVASPTQRAYSFDTVTLKKILRGALIAGGGAFAVAVLQYVSSSDFGAYSAIIGAVCAILINVVKEYIAGQK